MFLSREKMSTEGTKFCSLKPSFLRESKIDNVVFEFS